MTLVWALAACSLPCEAGRICHVAGTGDLGFNGDGLAPDVTRLASPTAVGVDPQGRVFWVDYSNMRVRRIEAGFVQTFAGTGLHAYSQPGSPVTSSPLENPVDATWGPDGDLYILPQHEGRVLRVPDSGLVEVVAGTGVIGDSGDGGDALDAEMGYGAGLAVGTDGTLYIADNSFSRVRRVGPDGQIETILGTGEAGQGSAGPGPMMAIRSPERLVLDQDRNRLLVADTGNHRVLAVELETLEATVLAGTGEAGRGGDGGPALEAQLYGPVGLAVGHDGAILVADLGNDRLCVIELDGTLIQVAGAAGSEPSWIDEPQEFVLQGPGGMAWAGDDLLIAERGGHRILRWVGAADAL